MTYAYPFSLDIGVAVLSEYDDDGFLGIGLDGDADPTETALQPAEALHPLGILSRPKDPDKDESGNISAGCSLLRLNGATNDKAILTGDHRSTPALPRVPKGSTVLYAPTGSDDPPRVVLRGDDETMVIHVPSTAKVTIEVEGGPQIIVDSGAVQLGVAGGTPVLLDNGFTGWLATLVTALATGGITVPAPPTIAATKVKGT